MKTRGLVGRKNIEVVLAQRFFARNAGDLFARPVEQHEAQLPGILDRDHRRDVLDHGIEETVGVLEQAGLGEEVAMKTGDVACGKRGVRVAQLRNKVP